ncbi:ATP-binding cassette domain-containing protein [Paracoccus tibetensis]|uniref:ATP-binding cassette domain-containing protein n=1 Tax=Paracoccus tibetensis TaxID=336292 RepID=UPI001FE010BF|nr:ATP-binding cassette domain-containing protein [Paracoccus tibetensis]
MSLRGICRTYGATRANDSIDLNIAAGEVLGLVGGNGAGKSTLMKVLCGMVPASEGQILLDGAEAEAGHDAAAAQAHGIRMVHQELSLCTNLTVAENFFVEAPGAASLRPGWRGPYRQRAREALDAVFPGHGISPDAPLGSLTLGERQMVEIARAAATPGVRLIILDEPTSSLSARRAAQLIAFVQARAGEGTAFIFISHKLQEITKIASSVALLRNGRMAWRGRAADTSAAHLIELMGGRSDGPARDRRARADGAPLMRIGAPWTQTPYILRAGQIVALTGLEGSGQQLFLHALFQGAPGTSRDGTAAFVAGDRQKEGIFPLWDVLANIAIGRWAGLPGLSRVDRAADRVAALEPAKRLRLDPARLMSTIGDLSGGNQQKALVARALVGDAKVVLLDDPTRGVDIATKQDFYNLLHELAAEGRAIVWHTTEDAELDLAHRALVFADGRIVADLEGDAIKAPTVLEAAFGVPSTQTEEPGGTRRTALRLAAAALPYVSFVVVLGLMFNANPNTVSAFGLELLLKPAVALMLIALAQMFIIGGSEIDLGAGAFAALISVLAATVLPASTPLGLAAIAAALAAYATVGALIQWRQIPAIVVTLGASFIWLGIGFSIQPTPGGTAAGWTQALIRWRIPGVPTSVLLICLFTALALWINRTPLGVGLRGFGNNPAAMQRSGWSPLRCAVIRYAIAGCFLALAGIMLTAVNFASDINSGTSYTLMSVAAVVMGGAALMGGVISPAGAVVGAMTLTLIGALLAMLNIPSNLNPATQGLLLLAVLALRSLSLPREDAE